MSMRKSTRTYLFALLLSLCCVPTQTCAQTYGVTDEAANQNTPQSWAAVELPRGINTDNVNILSNLSSSGDNTDVIQAALDAVPADGGVVVIPKGTWLSGRLTLKSKTVLHLQAGCTLKMLPKTQWEAKYAGSTEKKQAFIRCYKNASDIVLEGESQSSCILDGQGEEWWIVRDQYGKDSQEWKTLDRPGFFDNQMGLERFLIKNLTFKNSPTVNVRIGKEEKGKNTTIHDITILAPASELKYNSSNALGQGLNPSHNTDGIPVWTKLVNIYKCTINNGDDNVVMDSGAQYVHIWDCDFGIGHGASMGSYTSDMNNILWEDIRLNGTTAGIRLKTQRGRSGDVHDIIYRNITMKNVKTPISIDVYYDGKPSTPGEATKEDVTSTTPFFNKILIQNVTATGSTDNAIYLYGLPESYIQDVTFDNVNVTSPKGMFMAYSSGVKFVNNCKISPATFATRYNADVYGNYSGTYANTTSASNDDNGVMMLAADSYQSESNTAISSDKYDYTWSFKDSYSITYTREKDKGFGKGNENTIKYTRGIQYTIHVPTGVTVDGVKFSGYANDKNKQTDAFVGELNGVQYNNTEYVFPKDGTTMNYRIPLSTPVVGPGTLTFTPGGTQLCVKISLNGTGKTNNDESFVEDKDPVIISDETQNNNSTDVASTVWNFDGNYTISLSQEKKYGAANKKYVKFSKGPIFTIKAPNGKKISKVVMTGFNNYASDKGGAYLAMFNGNSVATSYQNGNGTYDFPYKVNSGTQDEKTITFDDFTPSGEVSFQVGGNQADLVITLTVGSEGSSSSSGETVNTSKTPTVVYLSDRSTIYVQQGVNPAEVTLLGRTFTPGTWNTICLPFDVEASDLETYFGAGTQLAEFATGKKVDGAVYFNTTDGGIKAGVPYLILPGQKNEKDIVFSPVLLYDKPVVHTVVGSNGYKFVGTYVSTALPTDGTGMFMVSGNKLRVATSRNNVMRGYRCYVLAPSTSAAKATRFVVEDAEATGISSVPAKTVGKAGAWYTLSGQRIDRTHLGRGIYIHGGKKVIIR